MSADRPKLGDVFRGPDRASGLGGLLPDSPRTADPASREPAPPVAVPEERPGQKATTPKRAKLATRSGAGTSPDLRIAGENADPATQGRAVVPVVLDASILAELREFGRRTDQTHGAVTLRAIETNAGQLATVWTDAQPAAKGSARLFRNPSTTRRRAEVGVQTQLRLDPSDAATLDQLVTEWAAPSRSALVNEALRRYVRPAITSNSGG